LAPVGPAWAAEGDTAGIATRAESIIGASEYTGTAETATQFLIESIVLTNLHMIEGYSEGVMPPNFGNRITVEEMADLVAYLQTFQ
jgi:mono/diheme cytochrome c family protein